MRTLFIALSLAAGLTGVAAVRAQGLAPEVLMKKISEDVLSAIRQDKDIQAGDARKIAALVEAKILPHFDFRRATQAAMGVHWRQATAAQQEELAHEFRTLLVRTYSGALSAYRDQVIEFRPLRAASGDTEVTVRSVIRQRGAEPIHIEYDLALYGSAWQVFDVRIGGMSLVATYRSAFTEEVRNHGIEGLISVLARKNRKD